MTWRKNQLAMLLGVGVALALLAMEFGATPAVKPMGVSAVAAKAPPAVVRPAFSYAISVKQFGAVGNGKHDDTAAIQRAIRAASYAGPVNFSRWAPARGLVVFPPGLYRITAPLRLGPATWNMEIRGAAGPGVTSLIWGGPKGGTMLAIDGSGGVIVKDLQFLGAHRAGKGITINSPTGYGFGNGMFSQLTLTGMRTGIVCGNHSYICSADMTLSDVNFEHCHTGFLTMSDQNLDYLFLRCTAQFCNTALHFHKGGSVVGQLFTTYDVRTVVQIDHGGINAGTYSFDGMRVDGDGTRFRTVVLRARGETNVDFNALDVVISGVRRFPRIPAFILGPTANVAVNSSMITGDVAVLAGSKQGPPTWIQFNNCRFRQNPLPQIKCDAYSGYALANCVSGHKMIHSFHQYAK